MLPEVPEVARQAVLAYWLVPPMLLSHEVTSKTTLGGYVVPAPLFLVVLRGKHTGVSKVPGMLADIEMCV